MYFFQCELTRTNVVRIGGWVVGDHKGPSIFLKIEYSNKQDVLIPNLASQILHGFYIKSYGKIKFEISRTISAVEISLKNDDHKRPLLEAKIKESFQKKNIDEKGF